MNINCNLTYNREAVTLVGWLLLHIGVSTLKWHIIEAINFPKTLVILFAQSMWIYPL